MNIPKGSLSLRSIGRKSGTKYPELSSSIKASTVKCFTVFLATVAAQFEAGDDHTRVRATCAWGMAEFIYVADTGGLILAPAQVTRLVYGARTYLAMYAVLARTSAVRNQYIWKVRPKLHEFKHLVDFVESSKLNPQRNACWHEESYLGQVKKLGKMCAGGTMLRTSLLRYFMYLGLRWERRRVTLLWSLPS
jgi:hypothetical protein